MITANLGGGWVFISSTSVSPFFCTIICNGNDKDLFFFSIKSSYEKSYKSCVSFDLDFFSRYFLLVKSSGGFIIGLRCA
jgi:hypothetical protein